MSIPSWWSLLLLAAAAWRVWHLIVFDKVLNAPRYWALGLGWRWKKGDPIPLQSYRYSIGQFLECDFCFGFWVALSWWIAWQIWPHGTLVVATPFAISAALVAISKLLTKTE